MTKIIIDVPQEFLDTIADSKEFETKTYDVCHVCPYLGKTCSGVDLFALSTLRRLEWLQDEAKSRRLTHQQIADNAQPQLSKSTVDSIFAGRVKDMRCETFQAIRNVIIPTQTKSPCHLASVLQSAELYMDEQSEVHRLNKELENANKYSEKLEQEVRFLKDLHDKTMARIEKQDKLIDKLLK